MDIVADKDFTIQQDKRKTIGRPDEDPGIANAVMFCQFGEKTTFAPLPLRKDFGK